MRNQLLLTSVGIVLIVSLFFWAKGPLDSSSKVNSATTNNMQLHQNHAIEPFSIEQHIRDEKEKLPENYRNIISKLEDLSQKTDDISKKTLIYKSLVTYWMDSVHSYFPGAFYFSEAAKLENSEKSLTFAGRLFLELIEYETDPDNNSVTNPARLEWESNTAVSLFEKAIMLEPANDELRLDLGRVYVYGSVSSGEGNNPMRGMQQILAVSRKDTSNMKAQFLLGMGGLKSRQFEKAIARFETVIRHEPNNIDAFGYLADAYLNSGNKEKAIEKLQQAKALSKDTMQQKNIDAGIEKIRKSQ